MAKIITIGSALVDFFLDLSTLPLTSKTTPEDQAVFITNKTASGEQVTSQFLQLELGAKLQANGLTVSVGGGGANVAVGLARAGHQVRIVAETGQDQLAQIVVNKLLAEGVDTGLLVKEKLEQTGGSVIILTAGGQRVALSMRGAGQQLDPFDLSSFWLSQVDWVHLSSIGGRLAVMYKLFALLDKFEQIRFSWNPGLKELEMINQGQLDLRQLKKLESLFVNQQEWQALSESNQQQLIDKSRFVVVTDGPRGGTLIVAQDNQAQRFRFSSLQAISVDDTGAGDAFATGVIHACLNHLPPWQAVVWGVHNASAVIGAVGAQVRLLRQDQYYKIDLL